MEDFNLNPGRPVISKDLDYLKQQIDILFGSAKKETMGDLSYGTDYETCLWELKFSAEDLENKMRHDLNELDLRGYNPTVKAYLLEGSERDIAVIEVNLKRGYESYTNIYKIQ